MSGAQGVASMKSILLATTKKRHPFAPRAARRAVGFPGWFARVCTPQLYTLARSLRRQLEQATGLVTFTTLVAEIPAAEYHAQVQDWQA
jgi:hypothetical protein